MEIIVHDSGTLPLMEHKLGENLQTEWNRAKRRLCVFITQRRLF